MPEPPALAPGDSDRDRLAAALGEHFAAGRLDIAELDGRLERVLAAASLTDAVAALDGLPALPGPGSEPGGRRPRRRHGEDPAPRPGSVPTLERFRDPSSGRLMRVWIDPVDRSRHYVAESP